MDINITKQQTLPVVVIGGKTEKIMEVVTGLTLTEITAIAGLPEIQPLLLRMLMAAQLLFQNPKHKFCVIFILPINLNSL